MRAADQNEQGGADRLIVPGPTIEPRRHFHPEPVFEPRPHIRPEPLFEPRPVHRPEGVYPIECPVTVEVTRTDAKSSASPIQPPWKVLPWQEPPAELPRPIHVVKVVTGSPDMCSKGSVIDLFI